MPLIFNTLKMGFFSTLSKNIDNSNQIASEIADIYYNYVQTALGANGDLILFKGSEKLYIKQAIITIINNRLPAASAASLLGNSVVQFWMAPPILTATGGVVTTVIPATGIAKFLGVNVNSAMQAAEELAKGMDLITKTVFFVYPNPIPPGVIK